MSDDQHDAYLAILADAADNQDPNAPKAEWAKAVASRLARDGVKPIYRDVVSNLAKMRSESPDAVAFLNPPKTEKQKAAEHKADELSLSEMTPRQKMHYHDTGERPKRPVARPAHLQGKTAYQLLEIANAEAMARWEKERKKK